MRNADMKVRFRVDTIATLCRRCASYVPVDESNDEVSSPYELEIAKLCASSSFW